MLWLLRTCSCLKNHAHKFPPLTAWIHRQFMCQISFTVYQQSKKQTCVWTKAYLMSRCMTPNWNQSFPFVVFFFTSFFFTSGCFGFIIIFFLRGGWRGCSFYFFKLLVFNWFAYQELHAYQCFYRNLFFFLKTSVLTIARLSKI